MLLCYDFIKTCKPGNIGAVTRGNEAGKAEAGTQGFEVGCGERPPGGCIQCLRTPHQEKGGRRIFLPIIRGSSDRDLGPCTSTVQLGEHWQNPAAIQHLSTNTCPGAGATRSLRQGVVCGCMSSVCISPVACAGTKLSGDK